MKVRTGFVSNSSSSSFCILGRSGDLYKFKDYMTFTFPNSFNVNDLEDEGDILNEIVSLVEDMTGLDCLYGFENEQCYIGYSFSNSNLYDRSVNELIKEVDNKFKLLNIPQEVFDIATTLHYGELYH
jgi:hypothetical protein